RTQDRAVDRVGPVAVVILLEQGAAAAAEAGEVGPFRDAGEPVAQLQLGAEGEGHRERAHRRRYGAVELERNGEARIARADADSRVAGGDVVRERNGHRAEHELV